MHSYLFRLRCPKLNSGGPTQLGFSLEINKEKIVHLGIEDPAVIEQRANSEVLAKCFTEPELISVDAADIPELVRRCISQLKEYLSGQRREFDLELELIGTEFQKKAWKQLLCLKYGETANYQEQAQKCGGANYCRAVGSANRMNPIILIVPCHRVLGKNGKLTGFSPGLQYKKYFLELEQKYK